MTRPRFSLRMLILLVTAAVLLLAYSQHRRREIMKASQSLRDYGYSLSLANAWHDRLWQRLPATGDAFYTQNEELLSMDLQNGDPKPIANLTTIGVRTTDVERRLAEVERKRIIRHNQLVRLRLRHQMELKSQQRKDPSSP
jgi:hypothetical protein